ncbi:MAG: hypothetical protein Q9167_006875 [Letrouitia subvulpina]
MESFSYCRSWKTTYIGLTELQRSDKYGFLERHIVDGQAIELLKRCFEPYPAPSPQSKSSFETKTSAINVSPSAHAQYDIKEIQDDALWLSKEINIDEVVALRIAVLEWQSRPSAKLLEGSLDSSVASLTNSRLGSQSQTSLLVSRNTISLPSKDVLVAPLNILSWRRKRLLKTYLTERRYVLKTCEWLVFNKLYASGDHIPDSYTANTNVHTWVKEAGGQILSSWNIGDVSRTNMRNIFVTGVDAIRSRMTDLGGIKKWLDDDELQLKIEAIWLQEQVKEVVDIMQLILTLVQATTELSSSDTVSTWFSLMRDYNFFEDFDPPFLEAYDSDDLQIKSLTSLISVAILDVSCALDTLSTMSTVASVEETSSDAAYLFNMTTFNDTNDIILIAAGLCLKTASPAVLAWSIILQSLREYATTSKEARETRQSIRALDRYGTADSSESETFERSMFRNTGSSQRRRSSFGSDTSQQSSYLEDLLEKVMLAPVEGDPIAFLAKSAVDGSQVLNVILLLATDFCTPFGSAHHGTTGLKMRCILLDLLRSVLELIDYQPDLILTTLAVLGGSESFWKMQMLPVELEHFEPASIFLADSIFMRKLFQEALSRFPYETWPFLKLCRALARCQIVEDGETIPSIWQKLESVDSLTCLLPPQFTGYNLLREDEDSSLIQLEANLNINNCPASAFEHFKIKKFSGTATQFDQVLNLQQIPDGTMGRVLSNSKPLVVLWRHDYSPLAYMGRLLKLFSSGEATEEVVSRETVSEIIGLIAVMLLSNFNARVTNNARVRSKVGDKILDKASEGLDSGQDVVSVVFDIFEQELNRCPTEAADESLDVLVQCIQFTYALLPIMPDRVWPFLGRSCLLGVKGGQSQLSAVSFTTEVSIARFDFLLGCVHVFRALVSDTITNAVVRKVPVKAVLRFSTPDNPGVGVSTVVMESVLLAFHRIMFDVFESLSTSNFAQPIHQVQIRSQLCSAFSKTISYCFETDDEADLSLKLAGPLSSSVQHLIHVFISSSNNDLAVSPLLDMIARGFTNRDSVTSSTQGKYFADEVYSALDLADTLVRVNMFLMYPRSRLEHRLLEAISVLANVYAVSLNYRKPVIELLKNLVLSADITENQPSSLLGQMGEEPATYLLEILSMIDQPLKDQELSIEIWSLFSAIVSKRQQWFAISVLTGETPREALKSNSSEAAGKRQHQSIFTIALDDLSNLGKVPPAVASAMLRFIALAANSWPWVFAIIEEHSQFLPAILEHLAQLETASNTNQNRSNQRGTEYHQIQIASYIVDILAMYGHFIRQIGNLSFFERILPSIPYIASTAISPTTYNHSLHSNLRRNFEDKFPGCRLEEFKYTLFRPPQLGISFYYNLDMANEMLEFEPAWKGKGDEGFAGELIRANVNLSVVEAQINLLHSWKALAIELGISLGTNPSFQQIMSETAMDCLRTNAQNSLPEAIFGRLARTRADFAFTLLQRLNEVQCPRPEMKSVLFNAWDAIRAHGTDLTLSLQRPRANYTRTLLKILCLALQVHTSSSPPSRPVTSGGSGNDDAPLSTSLTSQTVIITVLEILRTLVARGFRDLTTLLHSNSSTTDPGDFALLCAILRACLHVPGLEHHTTALLSIFAENQTSRYASTLLSWSDQLAMGRDPIFGELSISFLVEMSNVPALAESLAVEGILGHILDTSLLKHLSRGKGMGPFEAPIRMYSIWVKGILPLLLNLLHAVGASIAVEIAANLNQFSGMMRRASNAFTFYTKPPLSAGSQSESTQRGTGYVTLSMVSEAQNLGIITNLLDMYREAGPSAGVTSDEIIDIGWEKGRVKEDVENWLHKRGTLRERIVAIGEREEGWVKSKPVGDETRAVHRLEEKVVEEMGALLMLLGGKDE